MSVKVSAFRGASAILVAVLLGGCAGFGSGAGADADTALARFGQQLSGSEPAGPGLADDLARRNDLKTAAALYALRAQQAPTAAERATAFERLGDVLLRADRPRQAAGSYRSALREVPGHSGAQTGLGIALLAGGEPAAAVTALEAAVGSSDPSAYAALGAAHSSMGQHGLAAAAYERGLATAPYDKALLSNRALSAALAGDLDRAYADARIVADDPFATPMQQRNLPLVLAILGDVQRARNEGAALRLPAPDVEQVIAIGSEIARAAGPDRDRLVLALAGR